MNFQHVFFNVVMSLLLIGAFVGIPLITAFLAMVDRAGERVGVCEICGKTARLRTVPAKRLTVAVLSDEAPVCKVCRAQYWKMPEFTE